MISKIEELKERITVFQKQQAQFEGLKKLEELYSTHTKCAVLIALRYENVSESEEGRWSVLLTLRTSDLRSHPGVVCLPGGKLNHPKEPVIEGALREAQEEVGLERKDVEIIGTLLPIGGLVPTVLVWPVIAVITTNDLQLQVNKQEVDHVFYMPLERFISTEDHRLAVHAYFPEFHFSIHYFDFEEEDGGMLTVWGLTARILILTAVILTGRPCQFPLEAGDKVIEAEKYYGYLGHFHLVPEVKSKL